MAGSAFESAAYGAVAARGHKVLAKQTHHQPQRQQLDEAGKAAAITPGGSKLLLSPKALPQYDLSELPEPFDRLRRDKKSEVVKWAAAIANWIGDKHVAYPNKDQDKYHFRIDYKGMHFLIFSSPKHQEFNNVEKKHVLNMLVHMGMFGTAIPKLETSEE